MPGVNKAGMEITVENNELTPDWAGAPDPAVVGRPGLSRIPRPAISAGFSISIRRLTAEKITAKIEHGVVTLTLPKAESVKPRKIAITD